MKSFDYGLRFLLHTNSVFSRPELRGKLQSLLGIKRGADVPNLCERFGLLFQLFFHDLVNLFALYQLYPS